MIGEGLGNYMGQFLEYDEKNNVNFLRSFMRIKVLLDVRKPLLRSKKIIKPDGELKVIMKYERLGPFC